MPFNGAHMNLGNIAKLSDAVTRSVTAENVYGEKGKGKDADKTKKPKAAKTGKRPHEVRQRESVVEKAGQSR